jgi:site-specific DNA-adenine methylase
MRFIRYPGGKQQRLLKYIVPYLPPREVIKGKYTGPFAGSAAVFFALDPYRAIL